MRKAKNDQDSMASIQVNENISLEEQIAQRAHEIWQVGGSNHGSDLNDWLQAEAEVNEWHLHRRQVRPNPSAARPTKSN